MRACDVITNMAPFSFRAQYFASSDCVAKKVIEERARRRFAEWMELGICTICTYIHTYMCYFVIKNIRRIDYERYSKIL